MVLFNVTFNSTLIQFVTNPLKDVWIGVDLNLLLRGTRNLKPGHNLGLEIDNASKKMTLNITKFKRSFRYTVTEIYSLDEDEFEIPEMSYCCEALMASTEFMHIVADLSHISESIEVGVETVDTVDTVFEDGDDEKANFRLYFKAESELCEGKVIIDDSSGGGSDVDFHVPEGVEKIEHSFSSKYLQLLTKTCKIGKQLLFQLPNKEFPLSILIVMASEQQGGRVGAKKSSSGGTVLGHFHFHLAPFCNPDEINEVVENDLLEEEEEEEKDEDKMDID